MLINDFMFTICLNLFCFVLARNVIIVIITTGEVQISLNKPLDVSIFQMYRVSDPSLGPQIIQRHHFKCFLFGLYENSVLGHFGKVEYLNGVKETPIIL